MNFDIILLSPTRTLVRGGIFMSPAEYFGLHLHYETAMMFVRRGGPREQGRQENRSYERQELHGGSRALTRHNPWKNRGEPPPPEPHQVWLLMRWLIESSIMPGHALVDTAMLVRECKHEKHDKGRVRFKLQQMSRQLC